MAKIKNGKIKIEFTEKQEAAFATPATEIKGHLL